MILDKLEDMESGPEAVEELKRLNIPKLEERPRFLWSVGHYDGPCTGICSLNNERCWFQKTHEGSLQQDGKYLLIRLFAVVKVSEKEYEERLRRHKVFQKYIGYHTTYDKDGKRRKDTPWLKWYRKLLGRTSKGYYNQSKKWKYLDYGDHEVVAWWLQSQLDFDALLLSKMGKELD